MKIVYEQIAGTRRQEVSAEKLKLIIRALCLANKSETSEKINASFMSNETGDEIQLMHASFAETEKEGLSIILDITYSGSIVIPIDLVFAVIENDKAMFSTTPNAIISHFNP